MWLQWLLLPLLLRNDCLASGSGNDSAVANIEDEISESLYTSEERKMIAHYVRLHGNCSRTDWFCDRNCRLRMEPTGTCRAPLPGDTCFGTSVTYRYVRTDSSVISLLPHYQILSRYPRCWSALGPLLCAVAYRPCTVRKAFQYLRHGEDVIELWQLFRKDMCHRAMSECSFLVRDGLWPGFIDCSNGVWKPGGNSRLFANDSCHMPYKEATSVMERHQCFWPLVENAEGFRDVQPLIDDCYMPCFSSTISSLWMRSGFKAATTGLSFFIACSLLLSFIYLSVFSEVWIVNMCAYVLGHALLSGSLYYFLWSLSIFDGIARSAMCVGNGELRRTAASSSKKAIGWCGLQSFFLHTVLLSAYLWLCTFFVFRIAQPFVRSDHKILIDGRPDWSLRCVLLVIYLIAALAALPAFWLGKAESNGLMGVCFLGFQTNNDRIWIYFPIVLATLCAIFLILFFVLRRRGMKKKRLKEAWEGVATHEVCYVEQSTDADSSATRPLVAAALNVRKDQEFVVKMFVDGRSAPGQTGSVLEDEGFIEQGGGVNSAKNGSRKHIDGCGSSAVSKPFLIALCFVYMFMLFASLLVHLTNDGSHDLEQKIILESHRCSLNATILEGQTEWLNATRHRDHVVSSLDPLVRKKALGLRSLNAPGCSAHPIMDDHFFPLLLMYVVMPSLPLIAVVVLLLSGCCGFGFKNIEKIRENLNPFVWAPAPDNELLEVRRGDYSGLEMLQKMSVSECLSTCDETSISKRPYSSADCLNITNVPSTGSMPSQANSEPVKLDSASRVRKLDLKRLDALRKMKQNKNVSSFSLQSTGGTPYSSNEQLQTPLTQRTSPASLHSELASVYSHEFPANARSCDTSSASHLRDPNVEAASILSAYQTGLVEGFWQQMCHEYVGKVNTLVTCLREAEEEIRRLSGQPLPQTAQIPTVSSAKSVTGLPTCNGFPFVGLSLLQATGLAPNFENPLNFGSSTGSLPVQMQGIYGAGTASAGSCTSRSSKQKTSGDADVIQKRTSNDARLANGFLVIPGVDECPEGEAAKAAAESRHSDIQPSGSGRETNDLNVEETETLEVKESKRSSEADSNSFVSDEEDEEEAKLWEQKTVEAEVTQMSEEGPSTSAQPPQEFKDDTEAHDAVGPGLKGPSASRSESAVDGQNEPLQYILPTLKPGVFGQQPADIERVRQSAPISASVPQVARNPGLQTDGQRIVRPTHGTLFGTSRPPANASLPSLRCPAPAVVPPVAAPNNLNAVRPVLLSEEQARGLINLRSQLTGQDLLYYSSRLREEAIRRMGNREAINHRLPRATQQQSRRPPNSIREEDEEVPDVPSPSATADSSRSDLGNSSGDVSRRNEQGRNGRNDGD